MAKRMLADVLWDAANTYLSPDSVGGYPEGSQAPYSCWAIWMAQHQSFDLPDEFTAHWEGRDKVWRFVRSMAAGNGLCTSAMDGEDPQGNRYMWLLLAMHVAQDEGIEL